MKICETRFVKKKLYAPDANLNLNSAEFQEISTFISTPLPVMYLVKLTRFISLDLFIERF
jgi:hypothetical protein